MSLFDADRGLVERFLGLVGLGRHLVARQRDVAQDRFAVLQLSVDSDELARRRVVVDQQVGATKLVPDRKLTNSNKEYIIFKLLGILIKKI